jgi:hypothetical protein
MSWTWEQVTGRLRDGDGKLVGVGYSGLSAGKNNPAMQSVQDVGPIPEGIYYIGQPRDTVTHGPYVLPLTPDTDDVMFGRSGFLIHGDSVVSPGTASLGCIVLARDVRELIGRSSDHVLQVVSGPLPTENTNEVS